MKYGVVICPKCGMAKGVETRKKTTTCQCGREMVLSRMKIRFLTDSPSELAARVADTNAALRGGGKMPPEKRRPKKRAAHIELVESSKSVKDPLERLHLVAEGLTKAKGTFDVRDLAKVADALGKGSADEVLRRLLEHNLIYEVEDGRYKAV
ncbi:MAG TPA: hypothetical protein VJ489_00350 [Thermoplasmata archaeon]|nr:hypothetical protein [Thermoplasmata archaeon]